MYTKTEKKQLKESETMDGSDSYGRLLSGDAEDAVYDIVGARRGSFAAGK